MIKKGRYCTFDSKTGIKKYKEKKYCDIAYNAQKEAYEIGCAPNVVKKIDDYSYVTEIADTSFFDKYMKEKTDCNVIFTELSEKLFPIFKKYNMLGPKNLIDIHSNNLGIYKNKVVMLDFLSYINNKKES